MRRSFYLAAGGLLLATLWCSGARAESASGRGVACLDQRNLKCAVRELAQATTLDPENADYANQYGVALARSGNFDHAVTQFERALALEPAHVKAAKNLAWARRTLANRQADRNADAVADAVREVMDR